MMRGRGWRAEKGGGRGPDGGQRAEGGCGPRFVVVEWMSVWQLQR